MCSELNCKKSLPFTFDVQQGHQVMAVVLKHTPKDPRACSALTPAVDMSFPEKSPLRCYYRKSVRVPVSGSHIKRVSEIITQA